MRRETADIRICNTKGMKGGNLVYQSSSNIDSPVQHNSFGYNSGFCSSYFRIQKSACQFSPRVDRFKVAKVIKINFYSLSEIRGEMTKLFLNPFHSQMVLLV